ncbi:hypothetical protein VTO42DRAFT_1490 [Malbranchea cinnamomea]
MPRNHESPKRALALALVSGALTYAEDVLHPGLVTGIQCILLLTQYSMLDPGHFRPPFLDLRRKTFHCIYSIDRYVSTALGRAFSFSDDSIDVFLPESASLP